MTRASIAEALGVHESTISRAVSSKSVQLPSGKIIPISKFFDRSLQIRTVIKDMIANEDKPLSDTKIASKLEENGYNIARRTVAKYRSMEGILPAHMRKKERHNCLEIMPIQTLLRKSSGVEDFEILLDLLEKPSLIWNRAKGTIETCNLEFIKFSGYSRKEISEMKSYDLFPTLADGNWTSPPAPSSIKLASSIKVDIKSEIKSLLGEKHLSIISILPEKSGSTRGKFASSENKWEAIDMLLNAPLSPSLRTALKNCLKAGQILIQCDHLAIYLPIPGSESKLIQIENVGEVDFLPNIVHADEISHLNIPIIWTLGTRTPSILHQSALSAHQSFQATSPLNPNAPLGGFLTLGGKQSPPPLNINPVMALLCRSITASLNFNQTVTESQKELKEINYQLEIVRNIRNQISEGIIFVDMDFTIIDLNTSSSMILGYTESEMLKPASGKNHGL